jgi:hypothetical protein
MTMSEAAGKLPVIREAVGSFSDRAHFRGAVAALLAAGFALSDLSVLASHESLSAGDEKKSDGLVAASLTDEIIYIAPLTLAGIVVISGGPIAATVAALVGAGLGGAALKEIFDRYTAVPHRSDLSAALATGAVLLWVHCEDATLERRALRVLEGSGGHHVHIHGRPDAGSVGMVGC